METEPAQKSIVELVRATKIYPPDVVALENISLSIAQGEMVFLTGMSGAGKTTLLKLICGMEHPDKGLVEVAGKDLNRIKGGAVIIAGSGMCEGGRIRHHLKHNLWQRNAELVIVGYQAEGTLGRALVDGVQQVHLLGEDIQVNAAISTLGGYSAHAGRSQLLAWARAIGGEPRFCLVHGETEARDALCNALREQPGRPVTCPERNEVVELRE